MRLLFVILLVDSALMPLWLVKIRTKKKKLMTNENKKVANHNKLFGFF